MGLFNRKKSTQEPKSYLDKMNLDEWGQSNDINMYNFIQRN